MKPIAPLLWAMVTTAFATLGAGCGSDSWRPVPEVQPIMRSECFSWPQAVARLRGSLAGCRRDNPQIGPTGMVRVELLPLPGNADAAVNARARALVRYLQEHAAELLAAAGLNAPAPGAKAAVVLELKLSVIPGAGNFLDAELTGDSVPEWRELLELADNPSGARFQ